MSLGYFVRKAWTPKKLAFAVGLLAIFAALYALDPVNIAQVQYRGSQTYSFFEGALDATSRSGAVARIPLASLPGHPSGACPIPGYGNEIEIFDFLGPELASKSVLGTGDAANILLAFDSYTVTIESLKMKILRELSQSEVDEIKLEL